MRLNNFMNPRFFDAETDSGAVEPSDVADSMNSAGSFDAPGLLSPDAAPTSPIESDDALDSMPAASPFSAPDFAALVDAAPLILDAAALAAPTGTDAEVTFISGVAATGQIAATSFATWKGDNSATYATSAFLDKWGGSTIGSPGGTITYWFDAASAWSATEQSAFLACMALWSAEANVGFAPAASAAAANVRFIRGADGGAYETASGTTAAIGSTRTGTISPGTAYISIDTSVTGFGPIGGSFDQIGGYSWETLVHELGHLLGLGHAGAYNGSVNPASQQFSAFDSRLWTLMSYIEPTKTTAKFYNSYSATGVNWGISSDFYSRSPVTPMMLDIQAIQRLYGAPTTGPLTGGQTFGFNTNIDPSIRNFFDFTVNNHPVVTLYDSGRNNILDASAFSTANTISLVAGTFSNLNGQIDNVGIAVGTVIETAIGGSGADSIVGNSSDNVLRGGAGADTMDGGAGADSLDGGVGNDVLFGGDELTLSATQKSLFRLYGATLNRAPDVAGLSGWTQKMSGGSSLAAVTASFVNSTEFQTRYGALTNTQFVTLMYSNVLNRTPDVAGQASWLAQLNAGASRASVVDGFSESLEYQVGTEAAVRGFSTSTLNAAAYGQVFRLYGATLNRAPDAAGFEGWTNALAGGQSVAGIAAGFVASAEFQAVYGALNNTQFVALLYANVLRRAPDAAGLNAWINQLAGGAARAAVVNGFSESAEYQGATAAPLRAFMQTGIPSWGDTLNGGAGDDTLIGGRGADTFQFNLAATGNDHIYGFESWDTLNLTGFGYANAAAATSHMTQSGADVLFADRGETITFHTTALSLVASANYTFV